MKRKECKQCKYYIDKKEGYTLGECKYPVPAWVYASRYVMGHEAEHCPTYAPLLEPVE